jgi:hypothetical protein
MSAVAAHAALAHAGLEPADTKSRGKGEVERMRRLRITLLCVVAVCAGGALAAGSASAALPELGRCAKVSTPKTGAYGNAGCTSVNVKHKGEYEWAAGPGAKKGFSEQFSGATLETVTESRINCASGVLTGEYTGAKSEKFTEVVLEGCQDEGPRFECYTNPAEPGKIVSKVALIGELGFVPGSKFETNPWAGWDLKAENSGTPLLTFFCGEGGGILAISLEGSVIGRVTKTNAMVASFALKYKQKLGVQIPTAFIGGPEDVLKEITKPIGPGEKTEQVGLEAPGSLTNGESLEVKAKA